MKWFYITLLTGFLIEIESYGPLSDQENQKLQSICGRVPNFNEGHENLKWIAKKAIVGGHSIPGHLAPWSVRLRSVEATCSGTIISSRHILSASHCIVEDDNTRNHVLYGSESKCDEHHRDHIFTGIFHQIRVFLPNDQQVHAKVIKLVMLNLCDSRDFWSDDIMIIELDTDIQFSAFAQPVCVGKDMNFNHPGLTVHISSYGHNNTDVYDNRGVGVLRHGAMNVHDYDHNSPFFPVYDPRGWVNVRGGDSGGGAISYEHGNRFVVGIVSHAKTDGVTYFTSVGYHFQQICSYTGIC